MHWVKWKDLTIPKVCGGIGFKDLVLFNKAMLVKQGWRLICNPDSLCAQVLRGKYYHEGNLLTAGNKRNASHTWRAILYGREALKLGLIKRIGDGASTRIWDDPWIPSNPTLKPIVRLPSSDVTLVEELMNPVTGEWDEEVLETNFVSVDAQAIMRIPNGRLDGDLWGWHLERNGNFSVRSAYRALLVANTTINPVMGSRGSEQVFWKKLWKMRVPPKVRNFWW